MYLDGEEISPFYKSENLLPRSQKPVTCPVMSQFNPFHIPFLFLGDAF
jgi:hypothetical protein